MCVITYKAVHVSTTKCPHLMGGGLILHSMLYHVWSPYMI